MTTARRSAFMTAVVLVSALAGGIAFSGSATALSASSAAPFPHSPGTSAEAFPVSVVVQRNDAIASNGMKSITLNFGADNRFDGSVKNVSVNSVAVAIAGQNNQRTVGAFDVSKTRNGKVKVTFQQPVSVSAGDRIVVDVGNVVTPSAEGTYVVGVSATTPSGTTDGPVMVDYQVVGAHLTFPNQSASQFQGKQTVSLSGVVPNAGYIGVFTVAENGSRGKLVGSSQSIIAKYNPRNYTVNLNGNVKESQKLVAVVFYETSGDTQAQRLNGSLDPSEDEVVKNSGVPANATAYITTIDADARVTAGSQYAQGAKLYFSQGQPNTAYQVQKVKNGKPGGTVTQFETSGNGTAIIDTAALGKGQYVITRIADGSVVSLDNDSTTGAADDSFFITSQTFTETTATANGTSAATGGNTTPGADSGGNAGGNTSNGASGGNGNGSGGSGGSGGAGDSGGSGAFGPGFGVVVAVLALLGAALLATRRE